MKYRVLTLLGVLALSAGAFLQAQDYDDIYYDASKASGEKTVKVATPAKTVAVYGEVPERYKAVAQSNYRVERDEDEYNRRGSFEPEYEVDLNGDTIYEEAFANTRRIERFYNPDIVILSDDDDLVELYYDESPSINLIIGSDWSYASYGWDWPGFGWRYRWYDPWYDYTFNYGWWNYGWYSPYYYHSWYTPRLWGWNYWGPRYSWGIGWGGYFGWYDPGYWRGPVHHSGDFARHGVGTSRYVGGNHGGSRTGLATNRNGRHSTSAAAPGRNGISSRGTSGRSGTATTRGGGNMGSRGSSGVTTRNAGSVSRPSSGTRSSGTSYGGSRSSSSSRSSGGSYSGGSSRSSGGSYSGGSSRSSGGGGGHSGGSSGGGGRRR